MVLQMTEHFLSDSELIGMSGWLSVYHVVAVIRRLDGGGKAHLQSGLLARGGTLVLVVGPPTWGPL